MKPGDFNARAHNSVFDMLSFLSSKSSGLPEGILQSSMLFLKKATKPNSQGKCAIWKRWRRVFAQVMGKTGFCFKAVESTADTAQFGLLEVSSAEKFFLKPSIGTKSHYYHISHKPFHKRPFQNPSSKKSSGRKGLIRSQMALLLVLTGCSTNTLLQASADF